MNSGKQLISVTTCGFTVLLYCKPLQHRPGGGKTKKREEPIAKGNIFPGDGSSPNVAFQPVRKIGLAHRLQFYFLVGRCDGHWRCSPRRVVRHCVVRAYAIVIGRAGLQTGQLN
jgi:hypothetical protein